MLQLGLEPTVLSAHRLQYKTESHIDTDLGCEVAVCDPNSTGGGGEPL